ncbi:tetratricopeptide repeat protein [Allorhizocola rhizosphaerae]|uniref:tetratricopeptide repeat protein n=1 Tax=Allorhizocola rhizosphaerae TaxID=1872709 RepID=UPI0013C36274|nr:tetratricopeptide repeat protein [Allorhizocola rhizosphaerae]
MHDLIRVYAQTLTANLDADTIWRAAAGRLLDFYLQNTATAMDLTHPYERGRRPAVPATGGPAPDLSDRRRAAQWLDIELANLLAATGYTADNAWPEHLLHMSALLHRHLIIRGRYQEAEALHQRALNLACGFGNQLAQLDALIRIGEVRQMQSRLQLAADHFGRALQMARGTSIRDGESYARVGLGDIHRLQGRLQQAAEHYGQASRIAHDTGNHDSELAALVGLADALLALSRYEQATDCG